MNKPMVESSRKLIIYLRKNTVKIPFQAIIQSAVPGTRIALEQRRKVHVGHVNHQGTDALLGGIIPPRFPRTPVVQGLAEALAWKKVRKENVRLTNVKCANCDGNHTANNREHNLNKILNLCSFNLI